MPSGPKKRRAEKKKNDTSSKSSTNPACDTYEEKEVAAVEFQTADQQTIETPLMADGFETESVDDKIILTDTNTKKTEPVDSVSEENPDMSSKKLQDSLKEPLTSNVDDSTAVVHQSTLVVTDQNEEVGQEMKLLEQLVGTSAEIGLQAEKQVSLAKEFSVTLSRLLEELKFGKFK
ncbi:hypothetical protein L1987_12743 [Smallanthus sonchifolius]|uniref:Uncharacterized protein n=1 Tax=Smallanthus sonchifolius TaxID=185202 RepID=A0ACB9JI35_9ASTR|nr:hypothetical protein L1987_12743 [Smallanthus sonchifolius]